MSGLPSEAKKSAFIDILQGIAEEYKQNRQIADNTSNSTISTLLIVIQNHVGESVKEEVSRLKAVLLNRLNSTTTICVYAPLHIKSLRYELSSIALGLKTDIAHVYSKYTYDSNGTITIDEIEKSLNSLNSPASEDPNSYPQLKIEILLIDQKNTKIESYDVIQRIFESPRPNDKWDIPCFTLAAPNTSAAALSKVLPVLDKRAVPRTSSKKIIPIARDPLYHQKVKEIVDDVLATKKVSRYIPLKTSRQIESGFLQSVRTTPPPVSEIKRIFTEYLDSFLSSQN
ncbi:protein KTI12 [Nematocida sp. AWRm80]|nr:protein KTI12 [Nematocida sp. AWRm80]